MVFKKVWALYFSPTGTTRKIVTEIAAVIAKSFKTPLEIFDFTLPSVRGLPPVILSSDFVVVGVPVYAGRVPNVLLKYLTSINGMDAVASAVVLYGNRHYDDALIELKDILEDDGFHVLSAAAFVGEHSFSDILARSRPDKADLETAVRFAERTVEKAKITQNKEELKPVHVKGTPKPYRGYYQPRDAEGKAVDLRKVKPLINDSCDDCKICARVCPMSSISFEDVRVYVGICIKCGACVKQCPQKARYYDDSSYLNHKRELEEGLTRRAEPEMFT
jgi:NAD-dependent dihydropyrimidine dehydrogenase PreA subunit/NAD(P)H-dependent FMN reductase